MAYLLNMYTTVTRRVVAGRLVLCGGQGACYLPGLGVKGHTGTLRKLSQGRMPRVQTKHTHRYHDYKLDFRFLDFALIISSRARRGTQRFGVTGSSVARQGEDELEKYLMNSHYV